MKLNHIGSNQTEVQIGDKTVLFSYNTPVAVIFNNSNEVWKTNKKWSNTTTKHINKWLYANGKESLACEVDQKYLDNLVK